MITYIKSINRKVWNVVETKDLFGVALGGSGFASCDTVAGAISEIEAENELGRAGAGEAMISSFSGSVL